MGSPNTQDNQKGRKRKAASDSSNKKKQSSQFLIDGKSPIEPDSKLLAVAASIAHTSNDIQHGPGRHRSLNEKGFALELIDEIYPPLVCPNCYKTNNLRTDADQHLKSVHKGQKFFRCVSPECEQVYSSKPGLKYHIEHVHQITLVNDNGRLTNKKADQQTSIQNKKMKKKLELSEELQKKLDSIYSPKICPSCNEEFKKKTHVIQHLVDYHAGEEPYKCIASGCKRTKAYATREGLVYHLMNYHDENH